jgi:hypothetical protein
LISVHCCYTSQEFNYRCRQLVHMFRRYIMLSHDWASGLWHIVFTNCFSNKFRLCTVYCDYIVQARLVAFLCCLFLVLTARPTFVELCEDKYIRVLNSDHRHGGSPQKRFEGSAVNPFNSGQMNFCMTIQSFCLIPTSLLQILLVVYTLILSDMQQQCL